VWVRLHYVYPYPHVDEVIPLMAQGRILPYLDVPFQHASPRILRLMKRPASGEDNLARIRAWRAICPGITIRSTFIAGFPGETEGEFQELLDFLEEAQLDRVGCFAYSPVEGAAANALPRHVPDEVREERRARLMRLQENISAQRLRRHVGKTVRVLVDQVGPKGAVARSAADAPEIDGVVHIEDGAHLKAGEFAQVEVVGSDTHDLFAECGAPSGARSGAGSAKPRAPRRLTIKESGISQ
jgi:ribosomal protein S12 methylthiotransferase